ncbi:hypothetical protein [Radiobacillus sp. PE A8.2]|uniref:hypothetical protein n=1 Tax=Radiobacillus sp. PE A8.2 TaxID=3380349 RepID=UPI00388E7FA1
MEFLQNMLNDNVNSMNTAILYLVVFVIVLLLITTTITGFVLFFMPLMPKAIKNLIRRIVTLSTLAFAVFVWWQAVLPLV